MFSAYVSSISSMPSLMYEWRKVFWKKMAVNFSEMNLKSSWMLVLLVIKVTATLRPRGFDIVGNSFHQVAAILDLYIQHLFINIFHGHLSMDHSSHHEELAVVGS